MLCSPAIRSDLVIEATPLPFSGTCPTTLEPSKKVTIPVGVPAPPGIAETVAVKVTGCPVLETGELEPTAVVVALACTFCIIVTDVDEWFASPLYVAVTENSPSCG